MTPNTFAPFNRLKACRYGQMLYNVNDRYLGRSLDLYGEFSEFEVALFRQLLRPGDTVLDIGANIGAHTVPIAQLVGPAGRVLAFEPQRIVFQTLCANVALNHLTNVWCRHAAVGAESGHIEVPWLDPTRPHNFGGLALGNRKGERVPVVAVDELELRTCRLLKVDVEGMELRVLRGARQTIERLRPVLYVENDRFDRSEELIRFIESLGYESYWHRPPLYHPKNFAGNAENVFGKMVSRNMLCVHPLSHVVVRGYRPVTLPVHQDAVKPKEAALASSFTPIGEMSLNLQERNW